MLSIHRQNFGRTGASPFSMQDEYLLWVRLLLNAVILGEVLSSGLNYLARENEVFTWAN